MKKTFRVGFGVLKVGKEITLPLTIKGDLTDADQLAIMKFANKAGFVTLATAQQDLEDYENDNAAYHGEQPRGLTYTMNNGEVNVDQNQVTIDDVKTELTREETYKLYLEAHNLKSGESQTFEEWENANYPIHIDANADVIQEKPKKLTKKQKEELAKKEKEEAAEALAAEEDLADDDEISADEKEIESMQSEAAKEDKQMLDDDLPF